MTDAEFNEIINLSDTDPSRAIRALTTVVLKQAKKIAELESISAKAKVRGEMANLKKAGPIKR